MNRLKIYDNKGLTSDRYTVYYLDEVNPITGYTALVGMSAHPFHPQGFGQHGEGIPGPYNGREISFGDLPPDCQKLVRQDLGLAPNVNP